jgi:hypothetical protein
MTKVVKVRRDVCTDKRQERSRNVQYQLERIRCGKPSCQCATLGHGPYWFAYWRHAGVRRKRYIGRDLKLLTYEQLQATERSEARKKAARAKKEGTPE